MRVQAINKDLNKLKILTVAGARPNFIKIAPFIKQIEAHNKIHGDVIKHTLVHTGQHYDDRMSKSFFKDLKIPEADINLGIGSGTHAEQVGNTMIAFEKVLIKEKPNWVIVVGDVNATLACAVTAKKEGFKCCHIEAGLRSDDMGMPEEINRIVTDRLSDLLLAPDKFSVNNLKMEGIDKNKIVFVGNVMIDTLELNRKRALLLNYKDILRNALDGQVEKMNYFSKLKKYGLITIHRPNNVDNKRTFESLTDWIINEGSTKMPFIWSMHPRSIKQASQFEILKKLTRCHKILLLNPIGYLQMLNLNIGSNLMLTDSGGLQEECCVLGTPFLALRWNTERPITLADNGGTGYLVGNDVDNIRANYSKIMNKKRSPVRPEFWDGSASDRILNAILSYI